MTAIYMANAVSKANASAKSGGSEQIAQRKSPH